MAKNNELVLTGETVLAFLRETLPQPETTVCEDAIKRRFYPFIKKHNINRDENIKTLKLYLKKFTIVSITNNFNGKLVGLKPEYYIKHRKKSIDTTYITSVNLNDSEWGGDYVKQTKKLLENIVQVHKSDLTYDKNIALEDFMDGDVKNKIKNNNKNNDTSDEGIIRCTPSVYHEINRIEKTKTALFETPKIDKHIGNVIETNNYDLNEAWFVAVHEQDVASMERFIKNNRKLACTQDIFTSALHWAGRFGSVEMANLILSANTDNTLDILTGLSALHIAAQGNHTEFIVKVIEQYANLDYLNKLDYSGRNVIDMYPKSENMSFDVLQQLVKI
ncbi:hypothetical protein A3Q56_02605 [Intoshia linei]|uniref:Uncharacterized protein n=1 Tax=Intoshia linei TaxID=1819745 RepID=A0A177B7T9_9BILA|nr:hypothetical protein A3Q56_02605 [Intoshia linei]